MKHFGDITQIKGSEVPIVDVVTGGSHCQDLSVAGKRAGLDGERSGLFMEQIRIVKEMREHDRATRGADEHIRCVRPRYMVWENVPGAFSSNKGKDFQAVLTEIARIVCKDSPDVPLPKNGKWSKSGCLMGYGDDGQPFSIAYRLHDAQFWGVPQRRKRIALVADFGGTTAPEILFERQSVSRDSEQSEQEREETAGTVGTSVDPSSYTLKIRGGVERDSYGKKAGKGPLVQTELSGTLGVSQDQTLITGIDGYNQSATGDKTMALRSKATDSDHIPCVVYGICSYDSNSMKSDNPNSGIYEAETTRTLDNNGGNPACNQGGMIVLEGNGSRESHRGDGYKESETMYSLNTVEQHAVCHSIDMGGGKSSCVVSEEKAPTLATTHYGEPAVCYQKTTGCLSPGAHAGSYNGQDAYNDMLVVDTPSVVYGLDRASFNQGKNAKYDFAVEEELAQPLVARGPGGAAVIK